MMVLPKINRYSTRGIDKMVLTTRLNKFPVTIYFDGVKITSVYIGTSAGVDVISILSDSFLLDCYLHVTEEFKVKG